MNLISTIRGRANIRQNELAAALGWSQGRLSNYESERRQPSLSDSRMITAALNALGAACTLDEVFPPAQGELSHPERRAHERRVMERRQVERRA